MNHRHVLRRGAVLVVLLAIGSIAAIVLIAGGAVQKKGTWGFPAGLRNASGAAQLIHVEALPMPADGEMCEWIPASPPTPRLRRASATSTLAALQEDNPSSGRAQRSSESATDFSQRKPARMIRDPYASYSSVAVDLLNNEVVLTDENLFNILTYDRTANTPPSATMTEPKRMIGGLKTSIEFQCGLYIDPKNGDIYAVNNDTVDKLVIFSREARGDVPPDREIHTPHGTFGIAVDEEHQELMMTVQHDSAVVTFRKLSKPDDSPIRLLQGEHTQLADPHAMALDAKHDVIFVTNHGSVHQSRVPAGEKVTGTLGRGIGKENWPVGQNNAVPGSGKNLPPSISVYARTASGDTPPLRVISGPKTQMDWPTGIAYNPATDEIYIANDMGDSVLVFPASASGDVAPVRVLKGAKTHIKNPTGVFMDNQHGEMWVANFGNHSATVFKTTASGDTAPLRVIRSGPADQGSLGIGNPHPVGYDSKREQILVPN